MYTRNGYIFSHNFLNIVTLKLKFWNYNENNMGFFLTHKKSTTSG